MINGQLKEELKSLSLEELREIKGLVNSLIETKGEKGERLHREGRFKAKIQGECIIEREREFFNKEYKITILDLSEAGIKFRASANILKGDFLHIYFRTPWKGKMKEIYVEVMWANQQEIDGQEYVEAGGKSIEYKDVVAYRRALAKRNASQKK